MSTDPARCRTVGRRPVSAPRRSAACPTRPRSSPRWARGARRVRIDCRGAADGSSRIAVFGDNGRWLVDHANGNAASPDGTLVPSNTVANLLAAQCRRAVAEIDSVSHGGCGAARPCHRLCHNYKNLLYISALRYIGSPQPKLSTIRRSVRKQYSLYAYQICVGVPTGGVLE